MKRSAKSRLLSLLLALAMVISVLPVSIFATDDPVTATLVTDASSLKAGDKIVIIASGDNYALSTTQKTNNRAAVAVTKTGDSVAVTEAVQVLTLEAGTKEGTFAFNTGSGYLYAASSSKNYLKTETTLSDNSSWLIKITDGVSTIQAQGSNTHNLIRFNNTDSTNLLFACYASGQQDVSIYKLKEEEPARQSGVVTDLTTLQDGDAVVVFNPANGKALSTSYTGFYNLGTDVVFADGKLSGYTESDIWTIGINEDGSYTFSTSKGEKLSMGASYSSTPLDDVNPDWEISSAVTADCFYIKNVARGNYLEWYASKGNWSTYGSIGSNEDLFAQQIYLVVEDESHDPEPTPNMADKMETAPSAGDTVLIYNPAKTSVMGASASGKKLAGVTAAAKDNQLTIADDMAQLVVEIEEGGKYIFTLDGKYLTSGESGNGLSFADTLTDCGRWTLAQQTDGTWYIKNVGANYNGNYNQVLEYYNGFTTYGEKADNDAYKMEFYLVASAIADPITDDMIGEGVLTVKEANAAAATGVTVIGQVVYHYGKNYNGSASVDSIILEDIIDGEIYGFQIYDYTNYANYKVGDVVKVTGDIAPYGKVMQMKSPTMEVVKTGLTPIPAQEITVSQMGADYLSEYVHISGVTLGSYNASGNTTVTDATGSTNLFKGVPLPAGVTEADVTGLYACCSAYNGTYQLRNGSSEDYVHNATSDSGLPKEGSQVVIYNPSAEGVLALQDDNVDSPSIQPAGAVVTDGKALAENGALIFTVQKNGDYYRFYNETFGYLCSNGTGNNAFYSLEASEDADWTLTPGKKGGFNLESRTAKFNGQYSQYMEYYAGAFKTYSMYNVTDYDIYEFFFYPCANESLTGGVVNAPKVEFGTLPEANVGADYTFSFTVDAVFGVRELTVKVGETVLTANADGTYTIPAALVAGERLTITVSGTDTKGVAISGSAIVTVKDEPVISDVTPASGSQTGDNKRPVISAAVFNAGENPTVTMTVNGKAVTAVFAGGKLTYTPASDLADGRTTVTITVTRSDGKTTSKTWSFTVGKATYQLYFGQLHSHTTYSDGSGSLEAALEYVKNLPESANVDFVAFTDHSNYFDKSGTANPEGALYDMTLASSGCQELWKAYKDSIAEFNAKGTGVIAIGGFEMTWSGGPGHINTFNTPGIVSRNNSTLNNKTSDAGLKAYYALLSQQEGIHSISQLNHPGTTFGTFSDFNYWDALIDTRVYLVEVGNGEGAIGAGGYYPSYEYYTMALDKGWHVAPTNNQDNHKGKWGNANDARDVILTDDFSEEGIYEAIRNYRVYATEDKNLEILYTVNDQMMGTIMEEVPEKLILNVIVSDPDASDSISKVEVIVNSGKTAYTWDNPAELASGELTVTLDPTYSYYYIRVTEGDGDVAVTAPVWVGDALKLGISSVESDTAIPVTGEELTITSTLFNSEASDATIKSLTYTTNGSVVLGVDTTGYTIPASGSVSVKFDYTPTVAKVMTVTVTAVVELDGEEYTFSMDLELDVQNADKLVYIGIDASHHNEYVAGNYKDSMGNFGSLAAEYSVRTVILNTSEDLIAACSNEKYVAIILTAPSRRDGTALRNPYDTYSDAEIEALVKFNKDGGALVLCGWGDYYESYSSFPAEDHMAAQQNKILAALGSSIRISDDETKDDTWNGGQSQRLYLSSYNFDSFLLDGVEYDPENPHNNMYTELYSQYGGASIYVVDAEGKPTATVPGTVTPVVYGFDTTYSSDDDKDSYGGLGSILKYTFDGSDRLMVMATEQLDGQGLIVVSGAAFLSNFEVQATVSDSGSEKNYSNYKICENLLQHLNPVQATDISEVRDQTEAGFKYTIEGVVTSNASGYDKDTAFFDCIYVQDETGGICCFPVAGNFKIGDVVRVTGTTDFYQGEPELQVISIEKIGEAEPVKPTVITAQQLNDGSVMGSLVTLNGTVVSFELENGLVQTILVKDEAGNIGRVFIDGYITTGYDVENLKVGCKISVTGLASYDNTFNAPEGPFPRIRIRDRKDVVCTENTGTNPGPGTDDPSGPEINVPTGDNFRVLWIGLMVLAAFGIAVLVIDRKKRLVK